MTAEQHRGPGGPIAGFGALAVAVALAVTVAAAPVGVADPGSSAACIGVALGGCERSDDMGELVRNVERAVAQYLTGVGISSSSLPALVYIPAGGDAPGDCVDVFGDDVQHDRSFDYCLTDNAVYVGQSGLWDAVRQYGAAGPISGMAHEYGHFLQAFMQVPIPADTEAVIRHENQADCVSGDFMRYLDERGDLDVSGGALDSVNRYLVNTASADSPGRDHGTAAERTTSFRLGYDGALRACDEFYPGTPLTR